MAYGDQNMNRVHNYISNTMTDAAFVQMWQSRVKISNKNDKTTSISQFRLKNSILELLELCEKIKTTENYMRDNVSLLSSDAFNENLQTINTMKSQADRLIAALNDGSLIKSIKYKMAKRMNKRARLKRNKSMIQLESNKQKQIMELKSKELKEWINRERIEYDKKRKEEELKLKADAVLKDVNKRKAEAKRFLLLIEKLCKLRDAREKSASGRGENVLTTDKEVFLTFTEKLKSLWKGAHSRYTLEESRLKEMLEKDGNTRTLDESIVEDVCSDVAIVNSWTDVMFGNKDTLPQNNSHESIDQFIYMRKQWDQYVCSNEEGTRIPLGWLIPPLPSDDWKEFVQFDGGI
ncbi:programmed cell death protein 7 [Arctopsyche grandis]|uniref:programmed cell death protein 7 n=1 Tax=Arctopsyche grandis TaxID=121162 RepID=UPI00406D92CB